MAPDPLMARVPLFGTKIRVAGFGGLRRGEQNALRAIDVFLGPWLYRKQWFEVFRRDRCIGSARAREAADAVDRYGRNAPKRPDVRPLAARRQEVDFGYRPPASSPSSGPSLGL